MTAAIIWLVLWALIFVAVPAIAFVTFATVGGIGAVRSKTEGGKTGSAVAGFLIALIGGAVLWVVAAINAIIQLVTVIQLLTA